MSPSANDKGWGTLVLLEKQRRGWWVSSFFVVVKYLVKSNLKVYFGHDLRAQSFRGMALCQEQEASHSASTAGSLDPQPMGWWHPHLERFFPLQLTRPRNRRAQDTSRVILELSIGQSVSTIPGKITQLMSLALHQQHCNCSR